MNKILLSLLMMNICFLAHGAGTTGANSKEILSFYQRQIKKNTFDTTTETELNREAATLIQVDKIQEAIYQENFYPIYCFGVSVSILFLTTESSTCTLLYKNQSAGKLTELTFTLEHSGKGFVATGMGLGKVRTIGGIITTDSAESIFGEYSKEPYTTADNQDGFSMRTPVDGNPDKLPIINNQNVDFLITKKFQGITNIGVFVGDAKIIPIDRSPHTMFAIKTLKGIPNLTAFFQ